MKLTKDFYRREATEVARELLGKKLVRKDGESVLSGLIVETEAYSAHLDQASHTFKGKTKRNEVMFRHGGHLYVYFTYGMYYCCNVVTGVEGVGQGVLIRAIEPLEGISVMSDNRFGKTEITQKELLNLTSGPGKVCRALNITLRDNGTDLCGDDIYLLDTPQLEDRFIGISGRIGITRSVDLQWRFFIKDNLFVSKTMFKKYK